MKLRVKAVLDFKYDEKQHLRPVVGNPGWDAWLMIGSDDEFLSATPLNLERFAVRTASLFCIPSLALGHTSRRAEVSIFSDFAHVGFIFEFAIC